jgi:hypothetical protein
MLRITKNTVRQLNAAVGKLDVDTGQVFAGFVGRLEMADRLYHGELCYTEVGDEPPEEEVSIQSILSPEDEVSIQPIISPAGPSGESYTEEE